MFLIWKMRRRGNGKLGDVRCIDQKTTKDSNTTTKAVMDGFFSILCPCIPARTTYYTETNNFWLTAFFQSKPSRSCPQVPPLPPSPRP